MAHRVLLAGKAAVRATFVKVLYSCSCGLGELRWEATMRSNVSDTVTLGRRGGWPRALSPLHPAAPRRGGLNVRFIFVIYTW